MGVEVGTVAAIGHDQICQPLPLNLRFPRADDTRYNGAAPPSVLLLAPATNARGYIPINDDF